MSPAPPRPNPAVYPAAYTKAGRKLHRAIRNPHNEELWHSLCGYVDNWRYVLSIQGFDGNPFLGLADFDAAHAARLTVCDGCKDRAGSFA